MSERSTEQIRESLDSLYRVDSGRILATLIRLLGDFDLAEEAMHEAFAAALSLWPSSGVPGNPRPWLISTARFKAMDTLRRRARFDASQDELVRYLEAQWNSAERSNKNEEDSLEDDSLEDDRLRLILTCCHPSLAPEARVALTLREVCGLTTEEIAKAFLITPRTLAQRIVRAKAKIRETPIPYEVPTPQELPERLGAVLQVIYLVFNEGYSAAAGAEVTRGELTREAIRLGRLQHQLATSNSKGIRFFPDIAIGDDELNLLGFSEQQSPLSHRYSSVGLTNPVSKATRRYRRVTAHVAYDAIKIQNYSEGDIHDPNKSYTTRQQTGS